MRVLIKLNSKTEIVENVSVDDKCFPLVGGIRPYPATSNHSSHLAHQSALWFKTLALESVYIDCDRRLIYWKPIRNNADPAHVALRKTQSTESTSSDFIPSSARPLFEDSSLYDFDASLREMMVKCCESSKKFFRRSLSTEDFNKIVANVLHVYILPSVTFSQEDMFCLSRTRCLIEERLGKAEQDIVEKADAIEKLQQCLNSLKATLLDRESFESEKYLQTCKREFLKVFLRKVESDLETLNFGLEAEQSKVNWAKHHAEEGQQLEALKTSRDKIFHEINKLIRVREAIKNVISRKVLTKKKEKKTTVIDSCYHNIFVEINRRLDVEYETLDRLCKDKVNISGAREATVCAILELNNNNRSSDRMTKFEPEDLGGYIIDEANKMEREDMWLTFQERVSRILKNVHSKSYRIHEQGCKNLSSRVSLALSEYKLAISSGDLLNKRVSGEQKANRLYDSVDDTVMRRLKLSDEKMERRSAVVAGMRTDSSVPSMVHPSVYKTMGSHGGTSFESDKDSGFCDKSVPKDSVDSEQGVKVMVSADDIDLEVESNNLEHMSIYLNHFSAETDNGGPLRNCSSEQDMSELPSENDETSSVHDSTCFGRITFRRGAKQEKFQKRRLTERLALTSLMNMIENFKMLVQGHFREVVESLIHEIGPGKVEDMSSQEQQELLWKAYERSFCEKILPQLFELYNMALYPCTQKAYTALTQTPLEDLLKEDKILDLFFGLGAGNNCVSSEGLQEGKSADKISIAKTLSSLSMDVRHCDITDLYSLANADSNDLRKHFNLEDMDDSEDSESSGSIGSGGFDSASNSPTTQDGYIDGAGIDLEKCSSQHKKNRQISVESVKGADSGTMSSVSTTPDDTDKWDGQRNSESVVKVLDPVLSPFRKKVKKCLDAEFFLDKVRYITKAIEGLNHDISIMYGPNHQSACDDIISMLVLALSHMSEDVFIGLYVNLRLLMDILPPFLSGTLWDYNLVSLYASYDYLFTRNACDLVVKQYAGSLKVKNNQ